MVSRACIYKATLEDGEYNEHLFAACALTD